MLFRSRSSARCSSAAMSNTTSLCSISPVANDKRFDPLQQVKKAFPDTVEIKDQRKLVELCPDGTCDGLITSGSVPLSTLKDLASLYVYFSSDNVTLGDSQFLELNKRSLNLQGRSASRILGKKTFLRNSFVPAAPVTRRITGPGCCWQSRVSRKWLSSSD